MAAKYEMKDSGVEWMGMVPKHWTVCKQKYSVKLINGRAYADNEFLSEGKYRVLRVGNFFTNSSWYYSDLELESEKYCDCGDLLYAWSASYGPKIWDGEKVIFHYHIWKCKLPDFIDKMFCYYYFLALSQFITYSAHGTAMMHITMNMMNNAYMSVPSHSEQTAIASYLDSKCATIDEVVAGAKATIEEYKSWKASVIFEAVTKGLDPNVEMKDSGVEWIGMIPKAWDITSIKQHYSITLGKMLESEQTTEDSTYENYMCASNLKWGGIDTNVHRQMWFSPSEKQKYLLQEGDLLIMEGGSAGTSSIYHNEFSPCYIQNSVNRCRGKADNLATFLYYWMFFVYHCGHVESVCNRATIMHLTKEKLGRLAFVDVSPAEQACIVTYLDSRCAAIDSIISEKQVLIDELESYKKSLIFETVTGKRRVC